MFVQLSQTLPGPALSAALATVDRSTVDGHDLVTLLQARARQLAHDQAQLLADLVALVDTWRTPDVPAALAEGAEESAALEAAAALHWTHRAAEGWIDLATDILHRLPAVHAAMLAGTVDVPKARVFSRELTGCDDDTARGIVARLLPDAARLTTGQLGARIRKLLATADPGAAKERYRDGLRRRGLRISADVDGTGQLNAWGLPADKAAAAGERIDAIARAAKCAGDSRSMDQLRADVLLGLLTGEHEGPVPVHRRGVLELTVPLTTLIGLAEQPGELAGFGPVIADVARQVAQTHRDEAIWRYSVLDAGGRLLYHGVTRRRPTGADAAQVRARDRRCVFPGCRVPASRCDIDHRRRYVDGGVSTVDNLQPLCGRHHRAKDHRGWRVLHLGDGHHIWTSPRGHTHEVRTEPLIPP
jgi:hypothetical protein